MTGRAQDAKVTPLRKPVKAGRPKLSDVNLDRDIYAETCAAAGFDPLADIPAQPLSESLVFVGPGGALYMGTQS